MGCFSSKSTIAEPEAVDVTLSKDGSQAGANQAGAPDEEQPSSNVPLWHNKTSPKKNSGEDVRQGSPERPPRISVKYQAKEMSLSSRGTNSRRSSQPFDRSRIGTHTRHGLMPGPRGFSAAKINQDRGVVCWPFNGSYNQALLCVFDGHGSKGEKASEFCMKSIPDLLEQDSAALQADPAECLTRNVILMDEMLLNGEMGRMAMTCGTTSTIVYMRADECWVACSGDSRCVIGGFERGKVVCKDLSNDHKPDLPLEKERIIARGGTVSASSPGRPARVWANGRIGLAMSRSIGDGECKLVGVIPDPEVIHAKVSPCDPEAGKPDGDAFLIVASDGVWEFITSQEACNIVRAHMNATDACTALVKEAVDKWKRFEGSYRDDITAIVVYFPFLEDDYPSEVAEEASKETQQDEQAIFLNMGMPGLSKQGIRSKPSAETLLKKGTTQSDEALVDEAKDAEPADSEEDDFAARRLSVHNPFDEDWNDDVEEGEEAEAGAE